MAEGLHYDTNKPDISLVPPNAVMAVAQVMTKGAKKYARHNYRNGIEMSRLIASAQRHILRWLAGQNLDEESFENPLAHAGADVLMALQMLYDHPDLPDGRYKKPIKEQENVQQQDCHEVDSSVWIGADTDIRRTEAMAEKPFVPTYGC